MIFIATGKLSPKTVFTVLTFAGILKKQGIVTRTLTPRIDSFERQFFLNSGGPGVEQRYLSAFKLAFLKNRLFNRIDVGKSLAARFNPIDDDVSDQKHTFSAFAAGLSP